MPTYTLNQPIGTDSLAISQPILQANTNALDQIYGFDHFAYSNTTPNQGLHNMVTQPPYENPIGTVSNVPPDTSAGFPIIYSLKPYNTVSSMATNVPLIQFSRGITNAVPSPVTTLQSTAASINIAGGGTANVLDATNLRLLYGYLSMANAQTPFQPEYLNFAEVLWNGVAWGIKNTSAVNTLAAISSGNILQVKNASGVAFTTVYWTLRMDRVL